MNRIYSILLFLVFTVFVHSMTIGEETMVNLTLVDGLTGETVHHVEESSSGNIWIATNNGVNLYNGKKLISFSLPSDTHRTFSVYDICETSDKTVYAATECGLYRLSYGKGSFESVLPEITHPTSLLAVGDTLYIGGRQGLQIYDGKHLKKIDISLGRKGLDNIVRKCVKGEKGLIWFLGRYDLYTYNPSNGDVKQYSLENIFPFKLALTEFDIIGSRVFFGSLFSGLYVYDFSWQSAVKLEGVGNLVKTVRKSADGHVCVATDGAGAYLIDPLSLEISVTYNTHQAGLNKLPTNAVYSFYRDDNGNNWFGFVRYGLAYSCKVGNLFQAYKAGDLSTLGLDVRTWCLRGGESLIGTQDGLWYADTLRHITRYFSSEDFGNGHIVNSIAWFNGVYYIGTFDGGMRVLDPKTLTVGQQTLAPRLSNASICDAKVDPDGSLWVGSSEGLFVITKDGEVSRFTEQNSHIIGGQIVSITFDSKGNAWLTGESGISLYSALSGEIVEADFPQGFFDKQSYMRGARGHDSLIYMRNGPQLFYTTEDMTRFGELPLPVSLSHKWCRSMVDDMKGHLWLASEKGLFCFDYEMKKMLHFGYGEGLKGDEISEVGIDSLGMIWVCTSQGLFSLNPDMLEEWQCQSAYKVALYDIRRGSDLMTTSELYVSNEMHQISLSWNIHSEVLQAEAVLLDFSRQRGRIYEYRIDNGKWCQVEDGEPMYVDGLLPGHHRLSVRLASMEGTESVYDINVVPSGWAIFEFVLLLLSIVLLLLWHKYRKHTKVLLSERNDIEDALLEVEHELEEVRNDDILNDESVADKDMKDDGVSAKYQKVRIDEEECADIVGRMKARIETDKLYTRSDLKMKDLADMLNLSPSKLSQVFNLYLKENYYDFINRYRLDEFKRLIENGEHKRVTITALSELCGFKKSNFFSTFRKVEGMTPAEYMKKKGM